MKSVREMLKILSRKKKSCENGKRMHARLLVAAIGTNRFDFVTQILLWR